jgi:hypothetical protein
MRARWPSAKEDVKLSRLFVIFLAAIKILSV